eukprot:CAMPEP_0170405138 /NCGR_PEP_ID=MMETSP0117_2-20130122/27013_1 /TAXON_ID=400756 /ORGANISM="Durinskia baltica, Strain CSIRO CS-38" /LENGTH=82 /DNA_ID=CAMNT_0010662217 /DNA_START=125 /DNA_END=374 /DNA_ORIENTATION=+
MAVRQQSAALPAQHSSSELRGKFPGEGLVHAQRDDDVAHHGAIGLEVNRGRADGDVLHMDEHAREPHGNPRIDAEKAVVHRF